MWGRLGPLVPMLVHEILMDMAGSQGQVGVLVGGGRHGLDLLHQDDMIALRRDQKTLDILQRALFL